MTRQVSRRAFLAAAAGTVSIAVGTLTSAAEDLSGTTDYDWQDGDEDITREFDDSEVREYLPRFDISRQSRKQLIGIYAWIARSDDRDTDAYYYWLRYTHQDAGLEQLPVVDRVAGILASDSHLWDHEPAIVYVDSDTGELEHAIVTGYHHYPLEASAETAPFSSDETAAETHLELEVIDPWHHYRFNHDANGADVTNTVSLNNFIEVRDDWERRAVFARSNPLAVDNPWTLKDRDVTTWWDESTRDARAARIWHLLGLRGADRTDEEFDEL